MQDVLAQIKSGALICPRSGQTLAPDAARARLVTPDGRYHYPLLDGAVPVLLVDEETMRQYAADKVLAGLPDAAVCLSVGGGPGRCEDFTNVNIGPFPNVDVVADAHALPYADGSVHAIYCEAVIEHLYAPHQAVAEMYRALKPDGMVFAGTPFLYHYHGYPHHYQNFTLQGHENLSRRASFRIVESGACVGPVHAMVLSVAVFLAQYCTSPFGRFVSRLWSFSSQYLYPLDTRINTRPNAHVLAATTFVLAKKEAGPAGG